MSHLQKFFKEFIDNGIFDGKIVVGSPQPHGPFKTSARDGHYAAHLALFLGAIRQDANRVCSKVRR